MEFVLNLVWALLVVVILCLWLRSGPRSSANRPVQLAALAVLVLTLLPVISVTDDLQAMQNPAETDSCLRRSQATAAHQAIFPAIATLPPPVFTELTFGFLGFAALGNHAAPPAHRPALASIQNRPPPAA
jgi:hypothetical protein